MLYSWSSPALTERKLIPWSSGGPDWILLTRRVMEADTWVGEVEVVVEEEVEEVEEEVEEVVEVEELVEEEVEEVRGGGGDPG